MKLLHIDSSILGANSVSRDLSRAIVAKQCQHHEGLEIFYRDLATHPLQHLSGAHLAASGGDTPDPGIDVAEGLAALEEFLSADIVVMGVPMYNFGVPTQFKAWIDRIAIPGKTFRYTEQGPEGLAGAKKVIVASSRGGAYTDATTAFMDHQESYLRVILGFFGITDVTFIRAENVARSATREDSIRVAHEQIDAMGA